MKLRYKLNLMASGVSLFLAILYACYGRLGSALIAAFGCWLNFQIAIWAEQREQEEREGQ